MERATEGQELEFAPAVAIQRSIDHDAEYLAPPTPTIGDNHAVHLAENSPERDYGDDLNPVKLRETNAIPWPTLILPEAGGGAVIVRDTPAPAPVVTFRVTGENPAGEALADGVTVTWVPERFRLTRVHSVATS